MTSIYHYTSGSALLGIISNSEFWATDINFLNDHQEHVFGYNACVEYVKELERKEDDPEYGVWLKSLYQQLIIASKRNVIDRQTYIVSFSKKSDSIAHWFSYCEKNQGYCIEFDEDEFLDSGEQGLPSELFVRFEDVNYADSESFAAGLGEVISKEWIVSTMLDAQKAAYMQNIDIRDQNNKHADNFLLSLSHELMLGLFARMMYSSCSYKNEGFHHEVERRLMLLEKNMTPIDGAQPHRKFRERNGAIFPYTSIGFNKHSIKSILIGPCSDYEFKRAGLLKLLKSHGIECEVKQSASSLRFN
ncbi:DUF2971 domain-containing protein [Pseudomonas viridiflava]|uniref:DUF2971 domain-containing protein n=1 Tax=Pseudomonas viridiflava TaxID=33069 RepID=UPI000F0590CE|nr:DUF2971 domain-containing protein [Pseudomonas viridiflava]